MVLPAAGIVAARSTVRSDLDMLQTVGIEAAKESPPPTDLERLRARGIPTVSDPAFVARLETLAERRRLLELVQHHGYEWPQS